MAPTDIPSAPSDVTNALVVTNAAPPIARIEELAHVQRQPHCRPQDVPDPCAAGRGRGGIPRSVGFTTMEPVFRHNNVPAIPLLALTEEYGLHCREYEERDGSSATIGAGWIEFIL